MNVKFYTSKSGRCPISEFVDELSDNEAKLTIFDYIDKLEKFGYNHLLQTKDVKKINRKYRLFELRILFKKIKYRLLFTVKDFEQIILHIFIKKSKKTPPKEIEKAIKRIKNI